MLVTKIKFRGEWRNVVGTTLDHDRLCYIIKAKKFGFHYIPINDYEITERHEENRKHYPSYKKKINQLTKEEKETIQARYFSGRWTIKGLCDRYEITPNTLKKLIDEIRSKTKKM